MANNKVVLANGTVLIDITDTTANASNVLSGEYFYDASGVKTEGSLIIPSTYTVTKSLTNVTTNNNDTEVLTGGSFYMDLTPSSGMSINSITVTMGGIDVTEQVFKAGVGSKTITQNGIYDAEDDWLEGYSSVNVNVPIGTGTKQISISSNGTTTEDVANYANVEIMVAVSNSYSASDEGKVVSNGILVAQTSDTVTQNGTVDTTLINSLTVNVSGGGYTVDEFVGNTAATAISGAITINNTGTNLRGYSFAYNKWITSVSAPSLTGTAGEGYCFWNCTALESISMPNAMGLGQSCFRNCTKLTTVVLPGIQNLYAYNFGSCTSLVAFDCGNSSITSSGAINTNVFNGSSKLNVLILRQSAMRTLANINAFTNTPFASGKAGGTLYVPSALVSSYQAAKNWKTILGYANNSILPIEGSIYETQYADGTAI